MKKKKRKEKLLVIKIVGNFHDPSSVVAPNMYVYKMGNILISLVRANINNIRYDDNFHRSCWFFEEN